MMLEKLNRYIVEQFDLSKFTFRVREKYINNGYHKYDRLKYTLLKPMVFILSPVLRVMQEKRFEAIHRNGDVYEISSHKGTRFYVPDLKTDIMQKFYYLADDFHDHNILPEICKKYIPENAVICDIGANIGNHSIFFKEFTHPKRIYAFEPVKHTYGILKRNLQLNHCKGIIEAYNIGLGSKESRADVFRPSKKNSGSNQLKVSGNGEVQVRTLDSFCFDNIDFMKIDVEGFEYDVLLGGDETLKRCSPVILIEIFSDNYEKVNTLMDQYGYEKMDEPILADRHDYLFMKRKM